MLVRQVRRSSRKKTRVRKVPRLKVRARRVVTRMMLRKLMMKMMSISIECTSEKMRLSMLCHSKRQTSLKIY